ncbi:hypothetical protein HDU81_004260 [Chytriomyces hyalinus]|nr:hypothetical protein HDU81_004260 [Chytriomyces hyalinus]
MGQNASKVKNPASASASSAMHGPTRSAKDRPLTISNAALNNATALQVSDKQPAIAPAVPVTSMTANAHSRIELKFENGTLGTEIQLQLLEDLAEVFERMVAQLDKNSGYLVNAGVLIKQIEDVTVQASDFAAHAKPVLAGISTVSSDASETIDKFIATVDAIASAHPLLKMSWLVVYAGYKMVKDASEVNSEYLQLPEQFQALLESAHDFLKLPINGIKDEKTRRALVKATANVILCLTDAATLFTEYMDKPGTTWSNINGSNKKKLDHMNARLASVQEAHKTAKADGIFMIIVSVAKDVGNIKTSVDEMHASWKVQSAWNQSKSEQEKLRKLCQQRDPHKGEFVNLVSNCAKGSRKWIVEQVLESTVKGGRPVTWLRCEAGTGKSVIAALVVQKLKEQGLLGAAFFCKVTTRESLATLIQTIAFELAMINNSYQTALVATLENCKFKDVNNNKKAMPSIKELLQIFIEEPMQAWPKDASAVVVIDTLDEIKDTNENINWLMATFLRLPTVKLFITSRPEIKAGSKEITTSTVQSQIAFIQLDQAAPNNLSDLRTFAHMRLDILFATFKEFGSGDRETLADMLVENSSGLFVWMTLVLGSTDGDAVQWKNVLAHVRKNKKKLPETMEALIKSLEASASLGLQDLYFQALNEAFLEGKEAEKDYQLTLFKASVGTLMAIKVPISANALPYLYPGNAEIFEDISASLDSISALVQHDAEAKLSFIHKTVPDYLKGSNQTRCQM